MRIHIKSRKTLLYIIYSALIPVFSLFITNSASATNMSASVGIRPSMTFTIPVSSVSMNLNPATKPFDTKNIPITVGTNNPAGYQVFVSATGTDLTNTDDSSETIPTLTSSGAYDATSFPADYWGYKINTGNYTPFASGNVVSSATGPINEKTDNMTVAAKIDYLQPQGTYEIGLNFSIIPRMISTYMQDITADMCTEEPSIVMDNRDNQTYMIQKLDDGRCWMLDNLNLDLTNRDVVTGLMPSNTNASSTALNALVNGGGSDSNGLATNGLTYTSYIDGGWAGGAARPLLSTGGTCDSSRETSPCTYNGDYTHNSILSDLTPGVSTFGNGSGRIGIFYNFCAATAGSYCYSRDYAGPSDASQDICPAGWRLPTGGTSGEYQTLCDIIYDTNCSARPTVDSSSPDSLPYKLSLLDSGNYHTSIMYGQGKYGNWWSSTRDNAEKIYLLTLTGSKNNEITLQFSNNRFIGVPVRCILKEA